MTPDSRATESIRSAAAAAELRILNALAEQYREVDLAALAEAAGAEFERYAEDLLGRLMAEPRQWDESAAEWAQAEFHAALRRLGVAVRQQLPRSEERHTVAQVLQQKMFEAEIRLRSALDARHLPDLPSVQT